MWQEGGYRNLVGLRTANSKKRAESWLLLQGNSDLGTCCQESSRISCRVAQRRQRCNRKPILMTNGQRQCQNKIRATRTGVTTHPDFIGPTMPLEFRRNLRAAHRRSRAIERTGTLQIKHPLFIGPKAPRWFKDRLKGAITRAEHPERVLKNRLRHASKDPEGNRAKRRAYVEKNRATLLAKRRAKIAHKMKTEPLFRLKQNLRAITRRVLSYQGVKKAAPSFELLGCSPADFKRHIESQFQPGMTWANRSYRTWHIDHIIPCAAFDLADTDHQRTCLHYTNMRPMWAKDNMAKSDKITPEVIAAIAAMTCSIESDGAFHVDESA